MSPLNSPLPRSTLSIPEVLVVSTICFGLFTVWSTQAVLAGFPDAEFSDAGNVLSILIEVVLGAFAFLYLRARNFDVAPMYPRPELRGTLMGAVLYVATLVAGYLATAPFAGEHGKDGMVAFSFSGVSMSSIVVFAMVNGTFEEVFQLGALARSLRERGLAIAIGLPLLVRILYHLYQGPVGVIWVFAFGVVVSVFYLRTGRLWPVVFAHMLGDIVPMVLGEA